jgi:hypothetical protein
VNSTLLIPTGKALISSAVVTAHHVNASSIIIGGGRDEKDQPFEADFRVVRSTLIASIVLISQPSAPATLSFIHECRVAGHLSGNGTIVMTYTDFTEPSSITIPSGHRWVINGNFTITRNDGRFPSKLIIEDDAAIELSSIAMFAVRPIQCGRNSSIILHGDQSLFNPFMYPEITNCQFLFTSTKAFVIPTINLVIVVLPFHLT